MNNIILKRFFSKSTIQSLLSAEPNSTFDYVVKRYIKNPNGKIYEELISEIYSYMSKEYRTEYFYKNTMLNKLLLSKYHDYKKTIALTELPIGNSKADFVLINGKGKVYEIKTELDNLDRLESQIKDYYKAFTNIIIVTYEDNIDNVTKLVPETVGIMKLTKRKALVSIKEPISNYNYLDYYAIFKLLRKNEFENILSYKNIPLPKVSEFYYYKECFELIKTINIIELQKLMLIELKKRTKIETVEFCLKMPFELRFLTYFDDTLTNKQSQLISILNSNFGG